MAEEEEVQQYTKQMRAVWERLGGPLLSARIIVGVNSGLTLTEVAAELGIKVGTLHYWLLALDLRVERVALRRNEQVRIVSERSK